MTDAATTAQIVRTFSFERGTAVSRVPLSAPVIFARWSRWTHSSIEARGDHLFSKFRHRFDARDATRDVHLNLRP
ncbi:MAG TPA: hypothetical protein VKO16_00120, partial [Polyangia bacterium]|nr:hypothetical protein [Polyangia bacterium]